MTEESKEILSAVSDMFKTINSKIDTLQEKVEKLELTIENKTNREIDLLVEGHKQNSDKLNKLDTISDDVEYIKLKVDVIEAVSKVHSYDINHLKKAK